MYLRCCRGAPVSLYVVAGGVLRIPYWPSSRHRVMPSGTCPWYRLWVHSANFANGSDTPEPAQISYSVGPCLGVRATPG